MTALSKKILKGFSTSWKSWSEVEERLPYLEEAGFDGMEPTFGPGLVPADPVDALKLREICEVRNLKIPSMRGGRAFWCDFSIDDVRDHRRLLEHGRRALACLKALGGKILLVVPGRLCEGLPYMRQWQWARDFARELGDMAAQDGLVIGLENVEARFPLSLRDWLCLVEEIDRPNVGVYLDVGNVVRLDAGNPEDWLITLKSHIVQIHFKDAERGWRLRNLLAGDVDWPLVADAMRKMDYRGWVFVEPEWYRHAPHRLCQRLSKDMDAIFSLPAPSLRQ